MVPTRFHQMRAKLFAAASIKFEGAEEGALRSTVTFHQYYLCIIHFPRVVSSKSCHVVHRNVGLDIGQLPVFQKLTNCSCVRLLELPYTLR